MEKLKNYILLFLYFMPAITYINCDGKIAILEKPTSMKFRDSDQMLSSDFLESVEHLLGFQFEGEKQMELKNVFDYAGLKILLINADSKTYDAISNNAIKSYSLKEDMSFDDMINEMRKWTTQKNVVGSNVLVEPYVDMKSIDTKDDSSMVVVADLSSLPKDAIDNIMKPTEDSSKILKVIMVSDGKTSVPQDRLKRQSPSAEEPAEKKVAVTPETLNLADDYDENFPVIFNIMLWFSVALIFALIAICMVIANMDPGRDSIIYRMTSTRMKKDN